MQEGKPRRKNRRRVVPKFKENIITDKTKWIFDNSDFTGLMNEFRYQEKPFVSKGTSQTVGKRKLDVKGFLDYLVEDDDACPEDYEGDDAEELQRIKEERRVKIELERREDQDTFFN
jgi:hypothetical protein